MWPHESFPKRPRRRWDMPVEVILTVIVFVVFALVLVVGFGLFP